MLKCSMFGVESSCLKVERQSESPLGVSANRPTDRPTSSLRPKLAVRKVCAKNNHNHYFFAHVFFIAKVALIQGDPELMHMTPILFLLY